MMVDPDWFNRSRANDRIEGWWVRRWAYDLCVQLKSKESPEAWSRIIATTRDDLNARILRQAANTSTAAHVWFAVDLVETVNQVPEHRHLALAYLIQLALTAREAEAWVDAVILVPRRPPLEVPLESYILALTGRKVEMRQDWFPSPPATPADPALASKPGLPGVPLHGMLPLHDLPRRWILIMLGHRQHGVLRDLYRLVHGRAEQTIIRAIRESRDLSEWREAMALQIIARVSQHILPVTRDGMGTLSRGNFSEIAGMLFSDDELDSLRKGEAYAAEQYAHLSVALHWGWHEETHIGYLREITREAVEEWDSDPFPIRRALRAGRGRYYLPPFLIPELDQQYLKKPSGARTTARDWVIRYTWAATDPDVSHPRYSYARAETRQAAHDLALQMWSTRMDDVAITQIHIRQDSDSGWGDPLSPTSDLDPLAVPSENGVQHG